MFPLIRGFSLWPPTESALLLLFMEMSQLAAVGGAGLDGVVVAAAVDLAPCNHHRAVLVAVACLRLWLKHASIFL